MAKPERKLRKRPVNGVDLVLPRKPKPTTSNEWHDKRGKFRVGNPGGPGNPMIHKVSALRRALLEEITEDAVRKLVRRLLRRGTKLDSATGNFAAKRLLDRTIGKAPLDAEQQQMDSDINNRFDPDERFD